MNEHSIKTEHVQQLAECGKLFRDTMGLLYFQCNLCPQEFEFIAEFAMHLSDDHPLPEYSADHSPETEFDLPVTVYIEPSANETESVVKPAIITIKPTGSTKNFEAQQINSSSTVKLVKGASRAHFNSCSGCSRRFSPATFEKHITSVGPTIPPSQIQCTEPNCKKVFISKCQLKRHVRYSHKGKVHKCHLCEKGYITRAALETHIRIHNGIKPFECNECGRCFSSRAGIQGHLGRVHSGQYLNQCWHCGQSFNTTGFLKWHIKVRHSGIGKTYQCDLCEKAFYTITRLKTHHRFHTGERPFACTLCDKKFRQNVSLTRHTLSFHINARSFKCSYCPKTFNLKHTVRQHEKLVHEPKQQLKNKN